MYLQMVVAEDCAVGGGVVWCLKVAVTVVRIGLGGSGVGQWWRVVTIGVGDEFKSLQAVATAAAIAAHLSVLRCFVRLGECAYPGCLLITLKGLVLCC